MPTIKLDEILSLDRICLKAEIPSKKKVFELIAQLLAEGLEDIQTQDVVNSLCAREKLSSTAIGNGVALPHARVENLPRCVCSIVSLSKPIDFDTLDNQPIDLFFGLLVPESADDEHLQILSSIAKILSNEKLVDSLRACESKEAFFQKICEAVNPVESAKPLDKKGVA